MFVVPLRFVDRTKAPQYVDGHDAWIKCGCDGSVCPNAGGAILAHNTRLPTLKRVCWNIRSSRKRGRADIVEIGPGRSDERFAFLRA
jgi:hypothetical protein